MLRQVALVGVIGFFHLVIFYPSVLLILIYLISTVGAVSLKIAIVAIVLAITSSKLVWAGAIYSRDVATLKHLSSILKSADSVAVYNIERFLPGMATANDYIILNIANYRTYATIQYQDHTSFIIVPFAPDNQNALRTFWLLHECGHIGLMNRTNSLDLEIGRILAAFLILPGVTLAYPGPWGLFLIPIAGGIFAAMSVLGGRLQSEIAADYFAVQNASHLKEIATVFDFARLSPPPDRKLSEHANRRRRDTFAAMLKDVRESGKLRDIYYYLTEALIVKVANGIPLFVFVILTGLILRSRVHFGIEHLFLPIGMPLAFLLFHVREKRNLLSEIYQVITQHETKWPPLKGGPP